MFSSAIIDVAIGITFVFVLVSTLCAAIREGIESWLKTRAAYLEYSIRELLHDRSGTGLAKSFYEHPFIHGLYQGEYKAGPVRSKPGLLQRGRELPSYIPARSFALALMDLTVRGPATDAASGDPDFAQTSWKSLRENVVGLQNPAVQRVLLSAIDSAQGSLDAVRQNLEAWYDDSMDRVSGWYKRSTQKIIFFIALAVVGALNVNTLTIAHHLYRDDDLRSTIVAAAENANATMTYEEASKQLTDLGLPIGWSEGWGAPLSASKKADPNVFGWWNDAVAPILGLLITAIAATLGAPFWFDILNRVMVIRATVKPREKSPEEGSEDRPIGRAPSPVRPRDPSSPAPAPAAAQPSLPSPAAPATTAAPAASAPTGDDNDGCASSFEDDHPTPDEELPPARGGVA